MFIIIEIFGGSEYAAICTDENGSNKVFDTWFEAFEEAKNCQIGIVTKIL